jgi:PAS domain S-box-containing protein
MKRFEISLSAVRYRWKVGLLIILSSLLVAVIWIAALGHVQRERHLALSAFEQRSRSALQQATNVLRTLLEQQIRLLMPSDANALVTGQANRVLAPAQTFADVTVWSRCLNCHAEPLAKPAEHPVSESLRMLTAERNGFGSYTDENGVLMLAAWTTLDLVAQTWQIGFSLPSQAALAQVELHAQSVSLLAALCTALIFGAALLTWLTTRRERQILRHLRASQTDAREQRAVTEALSEIGLALTSVLELEEVMERILRSVRRVVPYKSVSILVADEDTYRLAYGRFPEDKVSYVERYTLSPELHRVLDEMVRTRQPRLIKDTETDPRWIATERHTWVKSYIGVPITVNEQVIGILNLSSDQRHHYTEQHAELLRLFAVQAGVALQNAQLYAESRRHAAELERRVQERTLQLTQRSALFEAIVENMTDGLAYFDLRTRRTLYVNSAFSRMSGCAKEALLDQPLETFRRFFQDSRLFDDAMAQLRDANRLGKTWKLEFEAVRADGSTFTCALTATVVRNAEGVPIGQLNLVRDVTDERTLQKQRERFIANASHELRTPITNLKLRLYLAQRDPSNLRKHFEVMEGMVAHLTRLVENLLDLPRFEQGTLILRRETTDLCALLRTAFETHQPRAAERQIAFHLSLPEHCVSANVDPMRLTQVIDNLIANALNYTLNGGNVRVQLSLQTENEATIACIRVTDDGIGIPPEALIHIFEPFFRAKTVQNVRGTGLGLTIAKQIVELHDGNITVESQEGVGSTFTVRLPLISPDRNRNHKNARP